jgi:class 3 adenylate cyclase
VRDRLTFLWNLRRSSDRRVRLGWYASVVAIAVCVAGLRWPRDAALAAGAVLSAVLCVVAGIWGVFHPRAVLPVRGPIWRWAAVATVIVFLGVYARVLNDATPFLTKAVPTANLVLAILVVLPLLLGFLTLYGWLGAVVSAYLVRRHADQARLTRVGVNAWWLMSLAYLFVIGTVAQLYGFDAVSNRFLLEIPLLLVPLLTALFCLLARKPEWELRVLIERALQRLTRYLTFRRRWRGRTLSFDFRGAALGLLIAAFVAGPSRPLLKAPSTALLVGMIQVRNQEARGAWNSAAMDDDMMLGFGPSLLQHDAKILAQRRKIALVDLDTPALRAAFAPSDHLRSAPPKDEFDVASVHSEAALQALLIRRLKTLGAAVIVLTPPQERPEPPSPDSRESSAAKADLAGRERSRRDEPLLIDAVKRAGNVVLALQGRSLRPDPPGEAAQNSTPGTEFQPYVALIQAAEAAGPEQLVSYGSVRIPALESGGKDEPTSLPLFIAQLYARVTGADAIKTGKRPTLTPVDFSNAKPDRDFLRLTASSLLTREPTDRRDKDRMCRTPDGQWRTLQAAVGGRIVFLDTPVPSLHETPVGALPAREVLAYGSATVLAGARGLRVSTLRSTLLTLFIGTLMGALCARRTPFEAVGRLAAMSALILFASLASYMKWTLWLDAVSPLAAILLTYLVVTQLAFTQEREKNRDLLKRFLAPQFVDAMLEDPSGRLGLGGKLSHVCVLFADVRNFTGFAESHTPAQVFEAVNDYMTALTNALHAYGGVLDKYTGDGLMAWFPAEGDTRVQVGRAVEASLAMRDAALAISQSRIAQSKPALRFGMGLHYGEAMIGLVGNEEHQINYTALGHAVVVSARLQSLAAGGELIISETVFEALQGSFQVEAREPVAVKGISDLVHPYHVLSA